MADLVERFEAAVRACHHASGLLPSPEGNDAVDAAMELATNWLVEFEAEIRAAIDPRYTLTPAGAAMLERSKG